MVERFKNNLNFTQKMNEHYLNEVIMGILGLRNISTPQDFIEKIGLDHKMTKLKDALQESLPFESVPKGDLYVLTPNEGFRYFVDSEINEVPNRMDSFSSRGTFKNATDYIVKEIRKWRAKGEEVAFNSIFFDGATKQKFRRVLEPEGLIHAIPVHLTARNYGMLTIYQFSTQFHQPSKPSLPQQPSIVYS